MIIAKHFHILNLADIIKQNNQNVSEEVFFAAVIGGELSMASQVLTRLDENKIGSSLNGYLWELNRKDISVLNTISFNTAKNSISNLDIEEDRVVDKLKKIFEFLKRFVDVAVRYPGELNDQKIFSRIFLFLSPTVSEEIVKSILV